MHLTDWWRLSIKIINILSFWIFLLLCSAVTNSLCFCHNMTIWQPPDLICNLQFLGHLAFVVKLFLLFGILLTILTSIKPGHNQLKLFLCSNCLYLDLTISQSHYLSAGDGFYIAQLWSFQLDILPETQHCLVFCSLNLPCWIFNCSYWWQTARDRY